MMNSESAGTGPINLGNPVENSILAFAEKIVTMTKSTSVIDFRPLPSDDPRQRIGEREFGALRKALRRVEIPPNASVEQLRALDTATSWGNLPDTITVTPY